jgi:hypothetical protein
MPLGAVLSEGSSGENISHFAAVRVRLYGVGSLKMKVYSLDDVKTKTLVPLPMVAKTRIIPTRIVNFVEQRASFEFKVTDLDEQFRIQRVVIYSKEIYTSYPG